ncbi:GNAT family N-acetyltransferase [Massilia eurypsychrophila]|jgi:GNAT superfamily N-acetyltransferase|uniref:GNAT family N-acetyltransferase n=1 Tax=Massilia eurypsychrophila TaxID=1485217 RepID=A0A2G8THP5_9BURK|nr:GNAT family N-acetyltransferase [Massilia eurypsychrophila]PIL45158.1 GNAT family N-acetyltransferase [Massilia eurypsychrophila]
MDFPLVFRPLPAPLSKKTIQAFRKDAGWPPGGDAPGGSKPTHGKVQWVTVDCRNKMIGIARLELAPPQFCYLSDLIISSAYRRKGVGDWFMKNIERYCLQFGVPRLLLEPRDGTREFYEKMHFVADPYVGGFLKKDLNPFQRRTLALSR